mmetsp:Transcript_21291/g.63604  ORF Transcript_21291/g.63604 Transcript_21291/m.63604 type:complete len:231 (-) Transcript_21291:235-927(-)
MAWLGGPAIFPGFQKVNRACAELALERCTSSKSRRDEHLSDSRYVDGPCSSDNAFERPPGPSLRRVSSIQVRSLSHGPAPAHLGPPLRAEGLRLPRERRRREHDRLLLRRQVGGPLPVRGGDRGRPRAGGPDRGRLHVRRGRRRLAAVPRLLVLVSVPEERGVRAPPVRPGAADPRGRLDVGRRGARRRVGGVLHVRRVCVLRGERPRGLRAPHEELHLRRGGHRAPRLF